MELIHNRSVMSEEQQEKLSRLSITVVGAGGLGGFVIEGLARLGAKKLTVVDSDVFDSTNLNRQLLCTRDNIGQPKALEAVKRVKSLFADIDAGAVRERLGPNNAEELLSGADVVFDCADSEATKLIIEKTCVDNGVKLIHGAVSESQGQACYISGARVLDGLYRGETPSENAVIAPMLVSALMLELLVSVVRGDAVAGRLITADAKRMETEKFDLH